MNELKMLTLSALAILLGACNSNSSALIKGKSTKLSQEISKDWTFSVVQPAATPQAAKFPETMLATVPGTMHTDLLNLGLIEDPFKSNNEDILQWLEEEEWIYKTTFNVSKEFIAQENQTLEFKGLDTYATVSLNGKEILNADNMFREWSVDVKGFLTEGVNNLEIHFLSAYREGLKDAAKYEMNLPSDNDKGEIKTSVFTRKAPYHYGWDWGPRFVSCGVWRPIYLEAWSGATLDNVQFVQTSQSDEIATFDVNVTLDADQAGTLKLMVCSPDGKEYFAQSVEVQAGENNVNANMVIKNPKLWWPNGTGEANLYGVNVIIADPTGKTKYDQTTAEIGVRTIELCQEPDADGQGSNFYFKVNGEPVFAKGANYIPQDVFTPRVTRQKYEEFIKTCVESNYNMIRVWGGGIYEEDYFYELCDKYGIMVWQDFMFACALYPWDNKFLENVTQEVIDNVERLRNHPSIAIWCGNNEITELWYHWGYQSLYGWNQATQDVVYAGMRKLFYDVIPTALAKLDTSRFYHPSSPLYGRGNPKSQLMGDVHYWGVFHDEEPFSMYKDKPGRFSNEYGFQSLACYDTYREYFTPEDMKLYSRAMVVHQKNAKGYRVIEEYMSRDLPLLKDDFRTYVYLSQLIQAEGIKIAMEGHRQKRPWTMGSLYWQVNDCWPVTSWSSLDSEGRYKALQYYAKNSFAPTALSFEAIDSTTQVKLWGLTDRLEAQSGKVTVRLMDFSGKELHSEVHDVTIPRNGNVEIIFDSAEALLRGADQKDVFMVAEGNFGGESLRALHYFTQFKNLNLPKADYDVKYTKGENGKVSAQIKANVLLKNVLFEADAIQNNASDGYFDMLPGQERTIELSFKSDKSIDELGIFVTTLNSLVGKKSSTPIKVNVE
ncbi:MAG: glycoside hydrolase family 2 TIM barrel-domain containing protein [Rikenellaceae bacterium]